MKKRSNDIIPAVGKIDVDLKIRLIKASKMPEAIKDKYIYRLMEKGMAKKGKKEAISLSVYLKLKKINPQLIAAMENYPPARRVKTATLEEWDKIFECF